MADQPDPPPPSPEADAERRLRRNVRLVGTLLGETLAEQEGEPLLVLEEEVRAKTKQLRDRHDEMVSQALDRQLGEIDVGTATRLIRAFSLYFQLVNVAELEHRVQVIRSIQAVPAGGPASPGTFHDLFTRAAHLEGGRERLLAALAELDVVPVVTAHPTEAVRRSVLDHVNGVAMALDALDGPPAGSPRHAALVGSMRRDMELLWQTEELRTVRPTVLDEARDIRFHLDLLMDVIPAVHAELDRRWIEVFGGPPPPFHPFLRLGSWVGGDRRIHWHERHASRPGIWRRPSPRWLRASSRICSTCCKSIRLRSPLARWMAARVTRRATAGLRPASQSARNRTADGRATRFPAAASSTTLRQ